MFDARRSLRVAGVRSPRKAPRSRLALRGIILVMVCMLAAGEAGAEAQHGAVEMDGPAPAVPAAAGGAEFASSGFESAGHPAWAVRRSSAPLFARASEGSASVPPSSARPAALDIPTSPEDLVIGRNDAMLNGALIVVGALGVLDNVVVHWILGWHRIIDDHPHALELEIAAVAVSAALLGAGILRERNARRRMAGAPGER
jgi:hypothetical protein